MSAHRHSSPDEGTALGSGAYALDSLTGSEARSFEAAMADSAELVAEVRSLLTVAMLIGLAGAPVRPSPGLRMRLLQAIRDDRGPPVPAGAIRNQL